MGKLVRKLSPVAMVASMFSSKDGGSGVSSAPPPPALDKELAKSRAEAAAEAQRRAQRGGLSANMRAGALGVQEERQAKYAAKSLLGGS